MIYKDDYEKELDFPDYAAEEVLGGEDEEEDEKKEDEEKPEAEEKWE